MITGTKVVSLINILPWRPANARHRSPKGNVFPLERLDVSKCLVSAFSSSHVVLLCVPNDGAQIIDEILNITKAAVGATAILKEKSLTWQARCGHSLAV